MKLSEIARVTVKKDSELYENMLGCDLLSRLQQREIQSEMDCKRIKKYKKRKKARAKGEK